MSLRFTIAVLLTTTIAACAAPSTEDAAQSSQRVTTPAGDVISIDTWTKHPRIAPVLSMVAGIDAKIARGSKTDVTTKEVCGETRTKLVDTHGIRYLSRETVSDDVETKDAEHYYDDAGRVRLVRLTTRSPYGIVEQVALFGNDGKPFWQVVRFDADVHDESDEAPWEESDDDLPLDVSFDQPTKMYEARCAR